MSTHKIPVLACRWALQPGSRRTLLAAAALTYFQGAGAFQVETGQPDLSLTWDTTVKYSNAFRLKDRSAVLVADPSLDDGDRNFSKGLVSNRLDLFTEADLKYQRVGARVSAAAWYDTVYNSTNDNNSANLFGPGTSSTNHTGVYNEFTRETRNLHGRKAELLDAFVFAGFDLGEMRGTVRLGQHTVLYGESFFLGANGIAAAQAPIDIVKALSVPGTQFKELMRPVPQVSGSLQLTDDVSIGAYYQFRWEANRIPAVGSYFSVADNAGAGSERLLPASLPSAPPGAIPRQADLKAKDAGQGGMQLRFRAGEADFGLYAVRYHAKDFQQYTKLSVFPTGAPLPAPQVFVAPGGFQRVYPEGIRAFGASYSQTFGDVNFASEVSARYNTPFSSQSTLAPGQLADNSGNPAYALGSSGHAQASVIWQVPKTPLFNEATLAAEVAFNRALSVKSNEAAIDLNTTRDAFGLRMVFSPVYRQVLAGLDLQVPIGWGANPVGRSRVVTQFNAPASTHGGDLSIGVNATYRDAWRFGLNYTHFYGDEGPFVSRTSTGTTYRTFQQTYADRDFVSFSARTSF